MQALLNDRPRKALGHWTTNEALRAGKGAARRAGTGAIARSSSRVGENRAETTRNGRLEERHQMLGRLILPRALEFQYVGDEHVYQDELDWMRSESRSRCEESPSDRVCRGRGQHRDRGRQ